MALLRFFLFTAAALVVGVRGASCPAPPTTVCNASPPTERPGASHCGDRGTAAPPTKAVLRKECFASFAPCRDACLANTQCVSFETTTPNGGCTLYSQGVEALGFQAKPTSPRRFYNRRCFTFDKGSQCSSTPPPTSSCPTVPTDFALIINGSSLADPVYALIGNYDPPTRYLVMHTGATNRALFNVANRDPVSCKGNLVLKGSSPPRFAAGAAPEAGDRTRILMSTDAEIQASAGSFAKATCSFEALLSCAIGNTKNVFYDDGNTGDLTDQTRSIGLRSSQATSAGPEIFVNIQGVDS